MTRYWDGRTDRQTDGQTDGVTALLDLLSPSATQVKRCRGYLHAELVLVEPSNLGIQLSCHLGVDLVCQGVILVPIV